MSGPLNTLAESLRGPAQVMLDLAKDIDGTKLAESLKAHARELEVQARALDELAETRGARVLSKLMKAHAYHEDVRAHTRALDAL